MKRLWFLFIIFCVLKANAQNYLISFTGTGASTIVGTVKVENLVAGTSLILNGSDVLSLTWTVGIPLIENQQSTEIRIFPNPMTDNSILLIYPPSAGNATITVFDISGKQIAQIQSYLENYLQEFQLSGIRTGSYLVNVRGSNWQYSGKLLSNGISNGTARIKKVSNNIQVSDEKSSKTDNKGTQATVDMNYYPGDRLKFTGISGIYSTVITNIPVSNKTITFNFIACSDGDNNNYPVVEIGTQVWMAENLKTTKYRNGDLIGTTTPASLDISNESTPKYQWAYDGNESNVATFGRLYTCYATTDNRNVCPAGWYLPTDVEWTTLTDILINNGYGYEGSGSDIAKSLATTSGWATNLVAGNVGNNQASNNSSGFTAVPSGARGDNGDFQALGGNCEWWSATPEFSGATDAWTRSLGHSDSEVGRSSGSKQTGYSVRCLHGEQVITAALSSVTQTTAICGGNVTSDGGETITARGVCWSTSTNPTIANNCTTDGTGTGVFSSNLTGLTINTKYYVRAYAANSEGTTYGNELSFATRGETGTVSDLDGNTYLTIQIGTQVWMEENLKTTKYSNGDLIGTTAPATLDISGESTPKYQWAYDGNETNVATYGRLYTWYTATDNRNVCPIGWHVFNDTEWTLLATYLGGESIAGGKLKENGTTHWESPNTGGTNETGFTALPGGLRYDNGTFENIDKYGYWWSATQSDAIEAWYRSLFPENSSVYPQTTPKKASLSIRCIKDN